jgi:hypothetical protein
MVAIGGKADCQWMLKPTSLTKGDLSSSRLLLRNLTARPHSAGWEIPAAIMPSRRIPEAGEGDETPVQRANRVNSDAVCWRR